MEIKTYSLREKMGSFFLAYLLMFISLSYFVNLIFQEALKINISVSAVLYGLAFLIGAASYFLFGRKLEIATMIISFILIFGTVLFLLIHSDYANLVYTSFTDLAYNPTIILFAYCIPALLISSSGLPKYEIVLSITRIIGRIVLILLIICYFGFSVGTSVWAGQYMSTSYNAMPAICICIISFTRKEKFSYFDGAIAMIGIFITLVGGSRGAFVADALFVLLIVLISPNTKRNTKIIAIAITVLTVIGLVLYFDKIIILLESYVSSRGMTSRTLSRITSQSFYQSNDRLLLWGKVLKATTNSPVFGYGVWGDRPIISGYTHNLFLEIFCSYGFVIGGIIIVLFIVSFVRYLRYYKNNSNEEYLLFLAAIPYGFIQLMFSDSYLYNIWFFVIIGIIISNAKRLRVNDRLFSLQ